MLVLYPEPTDRRAFEEHYRAVHVPLAMKLPGLRAARFSLDVVAPAGAGYFALFEADFDSAEALQAALASPEGVAVNRDVPNYATGGVQILMFEAEEP
ncbi:EthD family reductase [Tsukamurella soli]